ncbi:MULTISPECIES: nucleoside deaminase [Prochlorococcus]|uniref:nucleoside deaminase n=1 Tax=Prochlorococcus TaxID=1218 RepID=UPI000533973B|nr:MULTISPECIES: nucleoside deaminase [Prochlorococcus]KGG12321.1 tRNA-specific adenosine-34 deaminase [Prochlorococcus sp. MIT 0601]
MQIAKPIELEETKTRSWMTRLLKRASALGDEGEVPVAAVILNERGHCIGHGKNTRNENRDPLGHAELVALRQASLLKDDWRFNECTLICTLEPCQMCAAALIQARMGKVIFAAEDKKRGGLGGSIDLSKLKSSHHKMEIERGVLQFEAEILLSSWFKAQREKKRISRLKFGYF